VALRGGRGGISLYRGNESQPVAIRATSESEYSIRFVKDGKALLVAEQNGGVLVLTVIDLASGPRELWKRIPDVFSYPANQLFVATPDLKYCAYPGSTEDARQYEQRGFSALSCSGRKPATGSAQSSY
jgi:hypothetical protein